MGGQPLSVEETPYRTVMLQPFTAGRCRALTNLVPESRGGYGIAKVGVLVRDRLQSNDAVSVRRILALAVAICCHLGLLMELLRPGVPGIATVSMADKDVAALEVHFIALPQPTSAPHTPQTSRRIVPLPAMHPKPAVKDAATLSIQGTARMDTQLPPRSSTSEPAQHDASEMRVDNRAGTEDGGFRDRLLHAQRERDIHGVPGSDRPAAPGITFIQPADQGIGAVMRNAQRLFGITNRHCIDVDVWQNLTPDELKARNLSAVDVEKASQKYGCNQPLGLHF